MRKFPAVIAAVILAAVSGRLAGQTYRTFTDESEDIRSRHGLRVGPLKLLPAFSLSNVGYDSNIYYSDRNDQAVSDYTATLAPEVKACMFLGKSMFFTVTESPEYSFYLDEKDLRTLTNNISPAVRIFLLRRLALSGNYHDFRHLRRATSEFGTPVTDIREGWGASLFYETPRGSAVGFSGTVDDYRYESHDAGSLESEVSRTLDRREKTGTFEAYYRVLSRSQLFVTAGASDYAFRDPASAWRDARSYQTYGGFRFPLLGRARGAIALGYKKFSPRDEERKTFSGLVADTDVSLRQGRVGLSFAYTRDNYFSYIDTAYYYVENRVRAGLAYYVLPFLRLEAGWQAGSWKYPEAHEVWYHDEMYLITGRKDKNRTFSAGLAVRIAGTMGLSVSYNFYRRTSNAPGFDIDRDFVGSALAFDF
jgi:hypothetical protein